MVEFLLLKKVPIPRAKVKQADATPSSVLSRNLSESTALSSLASSTSSSSTPSASPSLTSSNASALKKSASMIELSKMSNSGNGLTLDGGTQKSARGSGNGVQQQQQQQQQLQLQQQLQQLQQSESKGNVGENAKSWWEGSPFVKKENDECIHFLRYAFFFYSLHSQTFPLRQLDIFSCAERLAKTSECSSVELTVTKTSIIIENVPSSSLFPIASVEGLFRFLSRREYLDFLTAFSLL